MLKKINCLLIVFFTFTCTNLPAQELTEVLEETLIVNSITAFSGNTRNITRISLPEKVKGYVYRISVCKKEKASTSGTLLGVLQKLGAANIKMGISLGQFVAANNDNEAVDAFIFNNTYDADNFHAKNDGQWGSCKSMYNRTSCCYSTTECMGQSLFFGFRNNNIQTGLAVKLEIVAIIDTAQANDFTYSYTVSNNTGSEIKYLISPDKINWTAITLRNGYLKTHSSEQEYIFIKIYTTTTMYVLYKLVPNERYKIEWNTAKSRWDIVRY